MALLSMKQVCILTSLSRAGILRKVQAGTFPAPIALGERKRNRKGQLTGRIAWVREEVEAWIADRIKMGRIVKLT
jgi:prophage regulatory protein